MAQASGSVKAFEKGVEGASSRTSKVASGLKAVFAGLAVAAALFFSNAISQAIAFEGAMRNVNSISYLSERQLATLSNQVIALSVRVPQSAKELADGLYDIASSGFAGAEGMKVLDASAVAASAGLTSTATSAKAITQVLNAYGLSADHAADVSDVLFQTVNLGVVTFEELATQLGDVVGGAAAAGVAIDEVGAATAAMTLAGLSAAESTTSLNNLIRSLIKPSDGLASAYQNLGIESGAAQLEQHGLFETMELLRQSTGGNITTLLQLFPEIRAARGAFALMAVDGQNYARTFAGIADEQSRAGATQRAFNEQMKGLGQQWKLFTNQVNAVSLSVGVALIPVLRKALDAVRELGPAVVDFFSNLVSIGTPAALAVWEALQDVFDLIETIGDELGPVGAGLAAAFGGAALMTIKTLAQAIGALAGFLADHPGLVRAVAIAYGGVLVGRLMTAAAALIQVQGGLLAVRAGLLGLSIQSALQSLAIRVMFLGDAIYSVFSMGNLKNLSSFKTAFQGLGGVLSSPALAGAVFVAGVYAITTGLQKAKQQAQEFIDLVNQDLNKTSVASFDTKIERLQVRMRGLTEEWEEMGADNKLFGVLKGTLEILTPMENKVLDNAVAWDQLNEEMKEAQSIQASLQHTIDTISNITGQSREVVEEWLSTLEDFDPSNMTVHSGELAEQLSAVIAQARSGKPATDQLRESLVTVSDVTATATDRVGAFSDALEALIGISLGAWDAETKLAEAIQGLGDSMSENGTTFDAWTEKGRENRDALSETVQAQIDYANSIAETTGSVREGVDALVLMRQGLINQLEASGMAKSAAEELINTLGLTPENIETLVSLEGADTAASKLVDVQALIATIDKAKATGTVELDTGYFDGDAAAITEWIEQIAIAAPEATVLLDGAPFQATAEQVTAWAQEYDSSTPEAEALLNVIDPDNKYRSLDDAAENWGRTSTSGTAGLNNLAASPMARNAANLSAWNRSRGTASAHLTDNASPKLISVGNRLDEIDGRQVHASISISVTAQGDAAANIALSKLGGQGGGRRWGGVHMAQTGMMWEAQIANDPTIIYGERPTGGEAMIPRLGMRNRSLSILEVAAGWYGMDLVKQGSGGGQFMSTVNNINVSVGVSVRAEAGVDRGRLSKEISRTVTKAMDGQMRDLKRELSRR
jgi:TP901 family phage tail tape measure protein